MARKWWTLIAVCVATYLLLLDITVVNTALPSIARDLHANFRDVQWVIDAYVIGLAAVVLTAGSLSDQLGRRLVFGTGLGVFVAASLVCGLASDATLLNVMRGIQGLGGAAMFAVSLALLAQEFPAGKERANALAAYGATLGFAVASGPLVGGAITSWMGWRWVFFLNVPVGLAAIAITFTHVRETKSAYAGRIDWLGLITFSASLFLLVLALLRGNDDGWGSAKILALLIASVAILALFIAIEHASPDPMLPLHVFKVRTFTGVQIAAFAVSASLFALFTYITLYLQDYLRYSPLHAGLRFLPMTLISFFAAMVAGSLLGKVHARVLMTLGLCGVGGGLLLISGIQASDGYGDLLPGFLLTGIGAGILNPVIADVAISVLCKERAGMASGVNDTFRDVGVAVGVAAWGAIFLGRASQRVAALTAGTPFSTGGHPRQLVEILSAGQGHTIASLGHNALGAARDGFLTGFNEILVIGGIVALVGAALVLLLVRESEIERGAPAVVTPMPEPEPEPIVA
jgi:EmrB/QacA subfamily drug resistance transporter